MKLLSTDRDHDLVRDEARELLQRIQAKCVEVEPDRKVSVYPFHPRMRSRRPCSNISVICRSYLSSSNT
jgi:hypothetical protein